MGPRLCSRHSTRPPCTSPSRLCFRCTLPAVPLVSFSIPVMVSPTLSPSTRVMPFPTPSSVSIWPSVATPSPPPPSVKSFATSRRNCATLPSTSSKKWPPPPLPHHWRNRMSCPMDRSSPLVTSDSVAPRHSSSHLSWAWNPPASTRPPTTQSWSATLTSVRICTPTPSFPVAPPCTPALPTACRRRSPPWPHPGLAVHLPTDVDLETRVRRVGSINCPP